MKTLIDLDRLLEVNPIRVLLVEDNPADVHLTKLAFESAHLAVHLEAVSDGEEALRYLQRGEGFEDQRRPDLILLDLNMPKINGKQVLSVVKRDVLLKSIPVIIMTTSEADSDIVDMYNLQANTYMTKPIEFDKFIQAVLRLDAFSVSIERMENQGRPRSALAAHGASTGINAGVSARPKPPIPFG
jgi:two-component system response regulator